ncbi:Hsp70 family protein [Jatrophihabitans sp. GAS493]|uniref:Hsp70 family protein n=1 Tax=Jatrophihabitans sp. GAS493 TaxID=1907575 RepID=UPI0015607706|nr:Hsp70 family protein [Jatrophihabitans sp. GAS493]
MSRGTGSGEVIAASLPVAVYVNDHGSLLCGEAAVQAGVQRPSRISRNFRGGLGDPSPVVIDSAPYSAETLLSALLAECLGVVERVVGERPEQVVLTCPVTWGTFRRELFDDVPVLAGVGSCVVVSDAQMVARRWFAGQGLEGTGFVAVFDLGGGAVEAAVLRSGIGEKLPDVVGIPVGSDRVGGDAFDAALSQRFPLMDAERVRALKHQLSESEQVRLENGSSFSRGDFEDLIRPLIRSGLQVLGEAIRSAGDVQLEAVLLVGGSARIPLLFTAVQDAVNCPVELVTDAAVALGAAEFAAELATGPGAAASRHGSAEAVRNALVATGTDTALAQRPSWRSSALLIGLVAVLAVALVVLLLHNATRGDEKLADRSASRSPSSAAGIPRGPGPVSTFYVVQTGYHGQPEYLYEIAQRFLTSGDRLQEIVAFNKGRLQPDGGALTDPNKIAAGWILILPSDAKGAGVQHAPLPCCFPTQSSSATP